MLSCTQESIKKVEEREIKHCQQSLNLMNKTVYTIFLDVKKQEMHSRDVSELMHINMESHIQLSMLKFRKILFMQQSRPKTCLNKMNRVMSHEYML